MPVNAKTKNIKSQTAHFQRKISKPLIVFFIQIRQFHIQQLI